jgi:hypothetical protein
VLTGLVLLGTSAPAGAQALTWSVVPSPNPGFNGSVLNGVSCVSAAACTAVGSYHGSGGTVIESWNGTSWSVVPSPSPAGGYLSGVSCVSKAACTAVGYYVGKLYQTTLIESWNGTSWSVVPSPNPGPTWNVLAGVSCVSVTACTAVGGDSNGTLIESWNGTSWSVVRSPNADGGGWLKGVSCVSATVCTAVGGYYFASGATDLTLIESWIGTSWSVVPSPNRGGSGIDNNLYGVSCVSATACTAVGDYTSSGKTLIESWNGTSWSLTPSPRLGTANFLYGVSCATANACTAVGYYARVNVSARTLIESRNGTSWSIVPSPNPGSRRDALYGVSCPSATACTAVGYDNFWKTLIESGTATG